MSDFATDFLGPFFSRLCFCWMETTWCVFCALLGYDDRPCEWASAYVLLLLASHFSFMCDVTIIPAIWTGQHCKVESDRDDWGIVFVRSNSSIDISQQTEKRASDMETQLLSNERSAHRPGIPWQFVPLYTSRILYTEVISKVLLVVKLLLPFQILLRYWTFAHGAGVVCVP